MRAHHPARRDLVESAFDLGEGSGAGVDVALLLRLRLHGGQQASHDGHLLAGQVRRCALGETFRDAVAGCFRDRHLAQKRAQLVFGEASHGLGGDRIDAGGLCQLQPDPQVADIETPLTLLCSRLFGRGLAGVDPGGKLRFFDLQDLSHAGRHPDELRRIGPGQTGRAGNQATKSALLILFRASPCRGADEVPNSHHVSPFTEQGRLQTRKKELPDLAKKSLLALRKRYSQPMLWRT